MKISVIIPHKNIPRLLQRCLDSIPNNNADVEAIVVDDASDADVVSELNSWKEVYPNCIFVFDETSKGAGHARNVGMEKATGDWVIFADADDFFEKEFWNVVFPIIGGNKDLDIIYLKNKGIDTVTLETTMRGVVANQLVDNYLSGKKHSEERLRYCHVIPWGKIFK